MARRRKKQKLLDVAIEGRWPIAASLAAGAFFFGFVLSPLILGTRPVTAPLVRMASYIFGMAGLLFALIAFFKYLAERSTTASQPSLVHTSQPTFTRHNAQKSGLSDDNSAWEQYWRERAIREESASTKPNAWSLDLLQRIEWKRYEDLCAAFYREKGIRCETTPLGADGGVDIYLFQDSNNPQATTVVQCKAWGRQVGVKPVRELLGVMAHEKISKGFFMAPGGFTDDASEFAQANRITLVDGKLFLAMLSRLPAEASQRLLAFATEGDFTTPACPSCGIKMRKRDSARGAFWGCQNYPACRQTLPMRKSKR